MTRPDPTVPVGRWPHDRVQRVISTMLRVGVFLSAAVVAIGGLLFLLRQGQQPADYRHFTGSPEPLRHVPGVLAAVCRGEAAGIIQLGLLLLIATPVLRVAFTAWLFVRQRDRLYVGVTLLVLAILGLSLLAPHWEERVAAWFGP